MTLEIFFEDFFSEYEEMGFENFKAFLKDYGFLDGRSDYRPTLRTTNMQFMTEQGIVLKKNAELFADEVKDIMKEHYYTFEEAIRKTNLRKDAFWKTLENLGYYNKQEDEYELEYNLFTEDVIEAIKVNAANIPDVKEVYLIQWVGPFNSVDECEEWEREKSISEGEYNFYYACGFKKNKRNESLYIGISTQKYVSYRIKQDTDPVTRDFRSNRDLKIWIGRFSDEDLRKKENRKAAENVEWALIYGIRKKTGDKSIPELLNERKMSNPPKQYITIINQWYNRRFSVYANRIDYCSKTMPDVILYNGEDNTKISERLKVI